MSKGVKIAIGCAVVLATLGVAAAIGAYFFVQWGKGKVREAAAPLAEAADTEQQIEQLKHQANARGFTPPQGDLIQEPRLLAFLEIRKRVFVAYEKHKNEVEALSRKQRGDWSDLTRSLAFLGEIRLAQARALSEVGMSEDEYRFMVEQVYKSMWASEIQRSTGGRSASEAAEEAYRQAAEKMKDAEEKTQAPGSEEAREAVRKGVEQLKEAAKQAREGARNMDVPQANVELFRKHEADIKKYAMGGLEWIGL